MHKETYRETWRSFGRKTSPYTRFCGRWPRRGQGRWWKRKLAKTRRRWQDPHIRGLVRIESECNWKGW